jgi:hypothetical protein
VIWCCIQEPCTTSGACRMRVGADSIRWLCFWAWQIVPQGDLVPMIDEQGINMQQIRCAYDRVSYYCHSLDSTIDEITKGCAMGATSSDVAASGVPES